VFQIQRYRDLLQRGRDFVVARSSLTDVEDASNLSQFVGAAARMVEQLFYSTAQLLELYSIYRARGPDLDARAKEYVPDALARRGATRAVGTVRWTRQVAGVSAILVPVGTQFARSDTNPPTAYVTTATGEIPAMGTQSVRTDGPAGDIPARAVVAGSAGNAGVSTTTKQLVTLSGTNGVTNPTPFVGGVDEESDDAFRARIVEHVSNLSRCTPPALEARAKTADLDGHRITVARFRLEPWEVATGILYVDDGSGQMETFESTAADEDLIVSATGGENRAYFDHGPLREDLWAVTRTPLVGAPVVLVPDIDYRVIAAQQLIVLSSVAFPTGLTAGDRLSVAPYAYYTGLVAEAQRLINGDPLDPVTYPTWHGAGVVPRVKVPGVRWVVVNAALAVLDGYDRDVVIPLVELALSDYINGLDIGSDVIHAELVERSMAVEGMYDVLFSQPTTNIPVSDTDVARIRSTDLEVL